MKKALIYILAAIILLFAFVWAAKDLHLNIRAAIFRINNGVTVPANGVFISRGYEASPNERGSVVVQAGEALPDFEGMSLTFAVDDSRAKILSVRRTAYVSNFDISVNFPAPGVANVAIVGDPATLDRGAGILEFELDLAKSDVNTVNDVIALRLLNVQYVSAVSQINASHDGAIKITASDDVPEFRLVNYISDVAPGIFPAVQSNMVTIRGNGFSSGATVFMNGRPLHSVSSSSTEIIAKIPDMMPSAVYRVSVDSLYADEKAVVFESPGQSAPVDVLGAMLFASPNPVLYNSEDKPSNVQLWIPVFNPLGAYDPIVGSVDFSEVGGDPNVGFGKTDTGMTDEECRSDPGCIGNAAVGPGGAPVIWFSVSGNISDTLQTNSDYQITVRAENRTGAWDEESVTLKLRAVIARGENPSFGEITTFPSDPVPGDSVSFYVDVSDPEGADNIQSVNMRLTELGGGMEEMLPAIRLPSSGVRITTVPYALTDFKLPDATEPGSYSIELTARDNDGNSARATHVFNVVAAGHGAASGISPQFSGRLETSPSVVSIGGDVAFYIGVRDPNGSDTLSQVTIDLVDVGGGILKLEPQVDPVPGSTQPVVYSGNYSIPDTIAPGVYNLGVTAIDTDGNSTSETLPLAISVVAQPGGMPVITGKFAIPNNVPAGGSEADVQFGVKMEDSDGISDVDSVSINLVPIGLPVEFLKIENDSISNNGKSGIFSSGKIKLPDSVRRGSYSLRIEASDKQGHRLQDSLQITVGAPEGAAPVFRFSHFAPSVVAPGGKTKLFVEVEDENGLADDNDITVSADFSDLYLSVEELDSLIDFPSGAFVARNTFGSNSISIPEDLPYGVYDIPLTAVDSTGNVSYSVARVRIERGGEDEGQPPSIDAPETFQTPRIFANDDGSDGELHVLVHDSDDDVLAVIANFGQIGTASSSSAAGGGDVDLMCDSSRAIVCMERGVMQDTGSRWFVLGGISIPPTTLAGADPYMVDLTAIDAAGHSTHASVPVYVGDTKDESALHIPPKLIAIVPVDNDEFELIVSNPVNSDSVERGGSQFVIRPALDAFDDIHIKRVSWDTSGRFLYITSEPLRSGEIYKFSVATGSKELTDVYGNRFSGDRGGTLTFAGFGLPAGSPEIERVDVIDLEHIDVVFSTQVLPSSVHPDIVPLRATLVSDFDGTDVGINGVNLHGDARTLRLEVGKMRKGDKMHLRIPGVLAPGRVKPDGGVAEKEFNVSPETGAAGEECLVLPTADLNGDSLVNFTDFAIFSSAYGTKYNLDDISLLCGDKPDGALDANAEKPASYFGFPKSSKPGESDKVKPMGGPLPDLQY